MAAGVAEAPGNSKVVPPVDGPPEGLGPVRGNHVPVEIERIVIGGLADQGVGFLGRVIATAGMVRQRNVTWLPLFSPSVLGASEHCTVLISKEEIGSPLAGVPDIVLAFDPEDFEFFKLRIKAGGLMLYDSGAVEVLPAAFRDDIRTIGIPAAKLAGELGDVRVAGMVMLGAFVESSRLLDGKAVLDALKRLLSKNDPLGLLELDRKAVDVGLRYVRERQYMYNRYAYSIFSR